MTQPAGWKTHRTVTQASGNTIASLDTYAAPVVPAVEPLLLPLKFREDSYYQVKSLEVVVELFSAGVPVAPGTLALDLQLFEVDYNEAREASTLIAYDPSGSAALLAWTPIAFASAPGPRRLIVGIVGQAGTAGAVFDAYDIRWRELA